MSHNNRKGATEGRISARLSLLAEGLGKYPLSCQQNPKLTLLLELL